MSGLHRFSRTAYGLRAPGHCAIAALTLVIACSLAAQQPAHAKSKKEQQASSKAGAKKGASKGPATRPSPSEETRAERERRLYRECSGMPNAGACKGFTRR